MSGHRGGQVVVGVPDGTAAQIDVLLDAAAELHRQRGTHTALLHAVGSAFDLRTPLPPRPPSADVGPTTCCTPPPVAC